MSLYVLGLVHYLLPDGSWTTKDPQYPVINTLTVLAVDKDSKTVTFGASK